MSHAFAKRRLFIAEEGGAHCQLFNFTQDRNDYSIYVGSPDFSKIKWIMVSTKNGDPQMSVVDSPGDGHLSVHATGMAGVRAEGGRHSPDLVIKGNFLANPQANVLGVRHLFTAMFSKPKHLPNSPAFNRKSDCSFKVPELKPYVVMFFAVPRVKPLTVKVNGAFHEDELESVPPEAGWGEIFLINHTIAWFAYRTKHMVKWPVHPLICYHDGYFAPMFIGTATGQCRLNLCDPLYRLSGNELTITLDATPGHASQGDLSNTMNERNRR